MKSSDGNPALPEQIRFLEAEIARWNEVLNKIDPASPSAPTDYQNARVAHGLAQIRLRELYLRARGEGGQTIDSYIDTDQENLDQLRVLMPEFRVLMPLVHELYDRSQALIPPDEPSSVTVGRTLLVCHKSFLAAAAAIGRRHPDDAGPLTRRAVEATCLMVAINHDPQNLERWTAAEERLARWSARHKGKRTPRLRPLGIRYPDHPVLEELRRYEGILSDAFVHFTPEFIAGQNWRQTDHGERVVVELMFLEGDQRVIERELLILTAIHDRILCLLDECAHGAFSSDPQWRAAREQLERRGAALGELFSRAILPNDDDRHERDPRTADP
jgi:hypothetical protein